MLDIIALLRREHRSLQILFEEYLTADDRPAVAQEICTELIIHAAAEEEVLYPVVQTEVHGGDWLVKNALGDHEEVEEAIASLDEMGYDQADADEIMHRIIATVTGHIQEEENDLLMTLKMILGPDRLAELGDELAAARARLEAEILSPAPVDLSELTRDELYQRATDEGIAGRSRMTRGELIEALEHL